MLASREFAALPGSRAVGILTPNQSLNRRLSFHSKGKQRTVSGELGVHQFAGGREDNASAQRAVADILDTLSQFNIHPDLIQIVYHQRVWNI